MVGWRVMTWKKSNMKNLLLLIVAIIGFVIFAPIGIVYSFITRPLKVWKRLSEIFLLLAELIDKMGNVVCADALNDIAKDDTTEYGDSDDTISFVTAVKWVQGGQGKTIEWLGKALDTVDTDHQSKALFNKRAEVDNKNLLLKSINY